MKQYNKTQVFKNNVKDIPLKSGVYGILDKNNNKIYIGSGNILKRRYYEHSSELRNNRHWVIELQNRWNLLGKDNFEFLVLEICDNYREKELTYLKDNVNNRFNVSENLSARGTKRTEEVKNRIREKRKTQIITKESYKKAQATLLENYPNHYRNAATKHSKWFKCIETNEVFLTTVDASKKLGISDLCIWRRLKGIVKSKKSFNFRYLVGEELNNPNLIRDI